MSIVVKSPRASMDTNHAMYYPKISGLVAGEDLPLVSAVKIDATTGKVLLAADGDDFAGLTLDDKKNGESVTVHGIGCTFQYTAAGVLTPGQKLYLAASANKGLLDTAATTGGMRPVAQAIDSKHIRVIAAI